MSAPTKPSLSVYSASAGSGKTHTLTGEFLRLALQNSTSFRQIQAITFTNKATAEMKERILSELHTLHTNPEVSPFREELLSLFHGSMEQLSHRAGEVLSEILSGYSYLRVKTIDSFFQEVIRGFARELGIRGSFRVELDQNDVLERSAVQLITQLDLGENRDLSIWLRRLGRDMINRGKGHNVIGEIKRLGRELFKEGLLEAENSRLPERELIEAYRKDMSGIIESFESELNDHAEVLQAIFDSATFHPSDFKWGSTSAPASLYNSLVVKKEIKEPTSRMKKFVDGEILSKDSLGKISEEDPLVLKLVELIASYIELFRSKYPLYLSAKAVLENLFRLGILRDLQLSIQQLSDEENTMLISDSTSLISRIIDNCDTPFIYERLGSTIKHHMIDEFQDTSRKQYDNLKPLLEEGVSHSWFNLIVGDVKQSIYRFRNADRSILSEQLPKDFADCYRLFNLQQNWRSLPQIVSFNNALYGKVPSLVRDFMRERLRTEEEILPEHKLECMLEPIVAAYEGQKQVVARQSDEEGAVVLHLYDSSHPQSEETEQQEAEEAADDVLCSLPETLIDIQKRGVQASDIAILVRDRKDAGRIATYLMSWQKEYPDYNRSFPHITLNVLSSEALSVKSSPSVRFLTDAMAFLAGPSDENLRKSAYQSFIRIGDRERAEAALHYNEYKQADFSPQETERLLQIARTDLPNMVEMLIAMIGEKMESSEQPYVLAFLDLVSEYLEHGLPDLRSFLSWWESKSASSCIESPANANAIHILTIHKSKGLGFPVVLLPYADWGIDIDYKKANGQIIWCTTQQIKDDRFHRLSHVPLSMNSGLSNTLFAEYDAQERINCAIDNLNLLYVLTTRAKDELHIWINTHKGKESKSEKPPQQTVQQIIIDSLEVDVNSNSSLYTLHRLGEESITDLALPVYRPVQKQQVEQINLRITNTRDSLDPHLLSRKLKIKREADHYTSGEQVDAIARGRALHYVLEQTETTKDLDSAIEKAIVEGLIPYQEVEETKTKLHEIMEHPLVISWFDGHLRVLREVAIVVGRRGETYRPDRVMLYPDGHTAIIVDYKFGKKRQAYARQLNRYRGLVEAMGYPSVSAYILYVDANEIEEVRPAVE
ncbi:UvrD/REP helicase domain protein [Porphyromonas crevioricanis JCM 15906]|uniref:DNA 3'-5' helicase n=1 Tax=Porphyromonas crevioricanis JCM 15906 TaxID=1305617 RepID=T1CGL9_9PORP|nr:UvrD-helicase domain-containing protein [Porphyromonas crevioricanis]GAD04856.1 UvrD/REP helicase domain protein [Porphyromonas crevioricanis JCM 15906]SJZ95363.1 ATP-dependent exoDNAse (exonuclease V) beta subunit (contains helicase and exonuclease domains) [Porphyromonas crevioricanis]